MAAVLQFRPDAAAPRARLAGQRAPQAGSKGGEIIIFPGVRQERHAPGRPGGPVRAGAGPVGGERGEAD